MLKSPDKIVDNADHTPKNDLLSELKKLKDLNQYLQGEIDELREDKQNLEEKLEHLL
jgi:predicted  nucleic acid-binding Zn-ribbon protein